MMQKYIHTIRVGVMALLFVCTAIVSNAQTITGSLNGTVTDPSGAVVPNANVTATNVDTGVTTPTTTNNDGIYAIRFLQIGNYKVTIEAPGFAASNFGPFALETGQNAKIDGKLVLAGQRQNIAVEATTVPLLNTENPTLATTLDSRAIENIPLVGRNLTAITMFLPGSVSTQPNSFVSNAAVSGPLSGNNPNGGSSGASVSVNGNRQQANQYLLDGMNVNQTLDDTQGYNPNVDAIGQVQVISANANAEYGNVNGGDILYQTKSGTNNWHGSMFYFLGNYNLDANSWKNDFTHVAKNSYTRNLFGGTFGGPILKDKLFFFVDYQGGRFHSGGTSTASVYTQKMRSGDFSELLDPAIMGGASKTIQLYDATTPGNPAFVNNQIQVLNPAAQYLFAHPELYPLPNFAPSVNTPTQNNYHGLQKQRNYGNQFDVKVDYKLSEKDNMFVRYSQMDSGQTTQSALPTTFNSAPTFPFRGVAINEVHQFSSSVINEFRAGYTRVQNNGAVLLDPSGAFGLNGNSILGIGANNPQPQAFAGFSALAMANSASPQSISASSGSSDYTTIGSSNTGTNYTLNTFLYGDNLTWSKSRHTFKFGAQFLRQQQNNFYPGNDGSLGGFYYLGAGTANGTAGGYTGADFVLNRASFVSKGGVSGPVGMRSWRDAYFAQDDWKVTSNLTLNLGVRYEYDQPIYEVNNKMSTIDPNNPSVILLDGTPAAKAAGYGRGLVDPYYGSVMPRIGFSLQATPRLVVRGGYGIQNFMEGTGANLRMTTNLPFQGSYQANGLQSNSNGTPGSFFDVQSGFGASSGTGAATGVVYNVWNKKIKPAFIGEYSLTLEYQVSNSASFQIGYLGESGQHLITANRRNQLAAPCFVNGQLVPFPTGGSPQPAGCPKSPYQDTPGVGYTGNIRYTDSNAMMNYNSLQASFRQRLAHGLQYTANYTYSRAMTNSLGFYGAPGIANPSAYAQNVYNMSAEYGPTGQDVRNAVNFNLVYDLPLGRGRRFGAGMPLVLDEVVGGWKVGLTGVLYSGFPVTLSANNNSQVSSGAQRPNHYRQLKVVNRSITNWFGTDPSATPCLTAGVDNGVCAYGQPAAGTFGTARVGSERAPSYQTYGASITKDFTVWHEQKINFRADADNVFNSAFLGNPQNNITNNLFGNILNQGTPIRSNPRQMQLSVKYHF